MDARELVQFEGPVQSRRTAGAADWILSGRTRAIGADGAVTALVSGVGSQTLPASMDGARLLLESTPAPDRHQRLAIEIGTERTQLTIHAAQIHRDAARAFYAALPGEPISARTRLGWTLLLWILRIPGAARALMTLRGRP